MLVLHKMQKFEGRFALYYLIYLQNIDLYNYINDSEHDSDEKEENE